jgi:hypothetical protein
MIIVHLVYNNHYSCDKYLLVQLYRTYNGTLELPIRVFYVADNLALFNNWVDGKRKQATI